GLRFFFDFDGTICRLYGALPREAPGGKGEFQLRRSWVVLDPTLRVLAVLPFENDSSNHLALFQLLEALPAPAGFAGVELQAPVVFLANVFEPDLCRHLIGLHEQHGGTPSGVTQERDGKTVVVQDHLQKRRRDYRIDDLELIKATQRRIQRRIVP